MRRVRLVINRPEVPQVRILWPLDAKISQNPRYSVFDLLTDINAVFPLDHHNHGVEDYVTEHVGCELLHFMPIGELIGDNDELIIRPLTGTETKEHVRGGRRQVSTNGRKLQDGVPIGRNFIAPAPDRPRIEGGRPSKRRKTSRGNAEDEDGDDLDIDAWGPVVGQDSRKAIESSARKSAVGSKSVHFEEGTDASSSLSALVLAGNDDEDEGDDEEDDEDFDPDNEDEDEEDSESNEEKENDESEDEDEDDESDSQLEQIYERIGKATKPRKRSRKVESSSNSESESDSSPDEASSEEESEEEDIQTVQTKKVKGVKKAEQESDSSDSSSSSESDESDDESYAELSDSDSSESSSDSDSSSDDSEAEPEELPSTTKPEVAKAQPTLPPVVAAPQVPPFEGNASTKSRNQRRRESKALAKLIKNQMLPAGSTKEDLRKWREEHAANGNGAGPNVPLKTIVEENITLKGEDENGGEGTPKKTDAFSQEGTGSPVYVPMEPLDIIVEQTQVTVDVPATTPSQSEPVAQDSQPEEVSPSLADTLKRRPVASDAAKRMILGGLGLRTPRNQAEDQKLREDWKKKNAQFVGNKSKGFLETMAGKEGVHSRFGDDGEAVPEEQEDPEAWKQKIRLSAVECDEEYYDANRHKVPQPSFPFDQQQLWKPEWNSYNTNSKSKKKKKKKNKRKREEEEQYQRHEQENWDAGYYDDSMQIDSAQRPGEVERSTQGKEEIEDDLPPIPVDLLEYPALKMPVLVDSVVVFTKFTMDNYSPLIRQVTAKILSVDGTKVKFQLAKRDSPKAKYNEETGERIFSPFHMPGMENEDVERGIEELEFEEMMEGRVIKEGISPAESKEPSVEHESERVPETIFENDSLDKDNIKIEPVSQDGLEDIPMHEPEDDAGILGSEDVELSFSGVVHQQSSSFVEAPFQTNGSCGYGHTDTEDEMEQEQGNDVGQEEHDGNTTTNEESGIHFDPSAVNITQSSTEAHRFDDVSSEPSLHDEPLPPLSSEHGSTPFHTAPEVRQTSELEEPVVQVPGTPTPQPPLSPSINSSRIHDWDNSVDISAFDAERADFISKWDKVKKECLDDTDILRERLKPLHHPNDTQPGDDDANNISVEISPPTSPKRRFERLNTQEALESSPVPAPLQDITERSTYGNNVENNSEVPEDNHNEDEEPEDSEDDESNIGSGSGYPGNDQSPPPVPPFGSGFSSSCLQKSDGTMKRRRKTGVLFRKKPSMDNSEFKKPWAIKREDENGDDNNDPMIKYPPYEDDYDDFAIPSTMPVRSLTSGKVAFSGRNDVVQNNMMTAGFSKKQPELVTISDADEDFKSPPPRSSLEIVGGNAAVPKPGKVKMKPQMIKKRIIPRRSESVGPEAIQSQRSTSSQSQYSSSQF
ncbi:hypothetical protein TWF694_009742 [Orbilia ellipsospora]|uniref:DUF7357 domain-containing protein n=1 Tax=Orbilia ellipsospora TaxID=2528407 RepID=A0AAV9XD52_9PEZI